MRKPLTGAAIPLYVVRMARMIQVRLPEELYGRLNAEARRQDRSAASIVRRALQEALPAPKKGKQ